MPQRGLAGDQFGAINALFSGLAFAGLITTLLLQRRELVLQRGELELTREQLTGSREQLEKQSLALDKQNFENTFFQMMRLFNDLIESIDLVASTTQITKGRDCFAVFFKRLRNEITKRKNGIDNGFTEHDKIMFCYDIFYQKNGNEIGHYFRVMYNIIKFVDKSYVDDKSYYTNLLRAQLSNDEISLLFYNCLSKYGSEKFKPLVEEYSLLKNFSDSAALINAGIEREFYSKRAFGHKELT